MTNKRDIGLELLSAIKDIKNNKSTRKKVEQAPNVNILRSDLALTQLEMATMLGVSMRTLQEWEQGRRKPSGPAQALLHVMQSHPEIFVR
ncbi:MAG: type II toxin-antitoxin system MqsA family antitoxin [Proteobacteria bacterium]|nr:type II toxin-antitoxin system MqsA family antitoxin [Pseudomonadota bacterium]